MMTVTSKKLLIACVLNLFAMPGAGHVYLKHRVRGFILSGFVIALLIVFFVHFNMMTNEITKTYPREGFSLEAVYGLMIALKVDLVNMYKHVFTRYLYGLICFYIIGFADLLYLYRKQK